jgi:hypothetical protein
VGKGRAQVWQWSPSQGSSVSQAVQMGVLSSDASPQSKQSCSFFNQM